MFTTELKDHVLVNNWANGFIVDNASSDDATIMIVFWPLKKRTQSNYISVQE